MVVSRSIEWNEQLFIESEEKLLLLEDKIISHTDDFTLEEIWDVSYRASSSEYGFFYLHTARGLFSYRVHKIPDQFIHKYREIQKNG
nr:hypothetical protein [Cytobacillus eiseniae]